MILNLKEINFEKVLMIVFFYFMTKLICALELKVKMGKYIIVQN